jgi:phenylpropionate dioxygenase-like ring-hydroxylating dioxygenase large terminal subunit
MTETLTGTDRSAGISFAELLDRDSHPVSEVLRRESTLPPGNTKVPAAVYTSKDWHDLEVEKLWKRVWQLACLEEEIPEVGDYHVYDIADLSFLIVRTGPDEIKAFNNACLHRGRQLRSEPGRGLSNIRCAFHGWCWELDGSLREIPCQWDFPDVDPVDYGLPEAKVDTWHGFVFINPDRGAEPLADFLGDLDEHFELLPFEKRHKAAHVVKLMPVNWKACQEAFMESYHVVATHPTLMETLGDANTRYDAFGNYSRAISPHAVESPHLANMTHHAQIDDGRQFARWRHPMSGFVYERIDEGRVRVTDLDGEDSIFDDDGNWIEGPRTQADPHLCKWVGGKLLDGMEEIPLLMPDLPPDVDNVRAALADQARAGVRKQWGDAIDVEQFSDAEMIDAMYYSVFPNWSPWGPFNAIFYRFRPNGNDPHTCIFEVMYFVPWPDDDTRPPPARPHHLGLDDDWILAAELGPLVKVFQQDSLNLPKVQRGLRAQERQEVVFASYNETKIRHFYANYFRWLGIDETPVQVNGRR